MRFILCGGGTAGHVTPAIAIAEIIKNYDKEADILFIGRENGNENQAIENGGYKIKKIPVVGLKRKATVSNISAIYKALKSQHEVSKTIKDFKPDVVIGTGGYVSWPVIKSAQNKKIPTLIHESNAVAGKVTKLLSKKCDRVLLNFSEASMGLKRKDNIRIVGNPIRKEFMHIEKKEARKNLGIQNGEILILSLGGSGGSETINNTIIEVMKNLSLRKSNIRHIHSSGYKYYSKIEKEHPELTRKTGRCIIKGYIDDMATFMSAADIVITRCGAMTLNEVSAIGKCAILIPSPNVADNHQFHNAKTFSEAGAAILLEENELTSELLIYKISELVKSKKTRQAMEEKTKTFYKKEANSDILNEIKSVLHQL